MGDFVRAMMLSLLILAGLLLLPHHACASERLSVQVGGFESAISADNAVRNLAAKGITCRSQLVGSLTKVFCGDFTSRNAADSLKARLKSLGYGGSFVTTPPPAYTPPAYTAPAPVAASPAPQAVQSSTGRYSVQVGSYSTPQNAGKAISAMAARGVSCEQLPSTTAYKVVCGRFDTDADARAYGVQLRQMGYPGAFMVSLPDSFVYAQRYEPPAPAPSALAPVAAAAPSMSVAAAAGAGADRDALRRRVRQRMQQQPERVRAPGGQVTDDVFSRKSGNLHPYLSIKGRMTDNLYSTQLIPEDDFITTISPGIWLAVPGGKADPYAMDMTTSMPSGMRRFDLKLRGEREFQTYLHYNADVERFSSHEEHDVVNHKAMGVFQYNFPSGHVMRIRNQYITAHDGPSSTGVRALDRYWSDRFDVAVQARLGSLIKLRGDYARFILEYDELTNSYRNRLDSSYSGFLFIETLPKIEVFAEYTVHGIDYEPALVTPLDDFREVNILGGFRWNIKDVSTGMIKGGTSKKDFRDILLEDRTTTMLLGQATFEVSQKTRMTLRGSRAWKMTDSATTPFVVASSGSLTFSHTLSDKVRASAGMTLSRDLYEDYLVLGFDRKDDVTSGNVNVTFTPISNFQTSVGYIHAERSSNVPGMDYDSNTFMLSMTLSL